ncbi:Complement C1q-like protein 3 [Mizuhopecten yessoensis]|uniref:Complement C1q-like protein 3 n=1 Tax=Mizuhopecten yessoensis TaxID=6573 RepID=A0A210QXL3_MIZYE|nr:Complement C1q-like protein 3 [Mizuhopecten yessoensis]
MEGAIPLVQLFCILTLVIGEMLTAAYMIEEPTVHAVSTDQTDVRTDQLVMLTKRMDELEQLRAKDVNELNLHVQELSELHENDARVFTQLNQEVEEQKRLRIKDLNLITMLTDRIGQLERQCGNDEQTENDPSKQTQVPPRDESLYYNTSDVTLPSPAAPTLDDMTKNEEDLPTHLADTSSSGAIRGRGRIQSKNRGRITRVPSDDIVAFHAILTHTIYDPSIKHVVVFDQIVTNSGGVHYSPNTGVFTCTQSGVHVFSWAIAVPSNQYVFTDLVRNNVVVGSGRTGQAVDDSAASATAATYLEVGDEEKG